MRYHLVFFVIFRAFQFSVSLIYYQKIQLQKGDGENDSKEL